MSNKAQLIYQSYTSGEIPLKVMQQHMALHIADTLSDHKPRIVNPPTDQLVKYVLSRLAGSISRDPDFAQRNGLWIQMAVKTQIKNAEDHDLLRWASCLLEEVGATEKKKEVIRAMREHTDSLLRFPHQEFRNALRAQEIDGDERRRG